MLARYIFSDHARSDTTTYTLRRLDRSMHVLILLLALFGAGAADAQTVSRPAAGTTSADGNARYTLGRRLLDEKDVLGALRELRQATVLLPNVGRVHYDYGRALAEDGDRDGAAKEFRLAIQLDPEDPDPHVALAAVLPRAEAIGEYRAALRLRPDFAEARRGLGNALLAARLLEMLQVIAKVGAGSITTKERESIQRTFLTSTQTRAGIEEMRKAIELSPRWARPHHDLAAALKLFGDQRSALAEYQIACNLEPANETFCADYRAAQTAR